MPAFFVFAIIFTVLMLEKRRALIVSLLEIVLYIGLCLVAYHFPDTVTPFSTEADRLADILLAFVSVSIVCGSVLYLHLKEYNQQQLLLEEQNLRLRSLDNAKSTFLTTVAHEIKNPLSSISLHARDTSELLEEDPLDFSLMQENLRTIEQSVMRIDRIVLDLMDTVSIEQGRLALSLVPSDLGALLHSVEKDFSSHPSPGNNQLSLRYSPTSWKSLQTRNADPGYHQSDLQCRASYQERNHHYFSFRRTRLADHLRLRHRNRHVRRNAKKRTQGLCFCR